MHMKENIYTKIKRCTNTECGSDNLTHADAETRGYDQPKHAGKTVLYCLECQTDVSLF